MNLQRSADHILTTLKAGRKRSRAFAIC